jgi:hypothetical protein
MLVDPKSLQISDVQEKRFARALKMLHLKPFVHPVQLLRSARSFNRGANRLRLSKTSPTDFTEENKVAVRETVEENRESKFQPHFAMLCS